MTYLSACHELDDLGGGRFRSTIHLRPIAYRENGVYKLNTLDWVDDGGPGWPHAVSRAPMLTYVASDGMRRLCPTRDRDKYVEIGPPYIKPAGTWNKVNLGTPTRTANRLAWTTVQADVNVYHAGHFVKLEVALKGWVPPNNQVAFPVGMQGLTRQGTDFYDGDRLVMHMASPVIYDAANPADARPVTSTLTQVSSQWYILLTLPSLIGMAQPVLDPTLVLQPDAASGKDTLVSSGANSTKNYGATNFVVGSNTSKGMLQFDLSAIQAGSTCTSALLSLYQSATGAAAAWTVTAYSVALANVWVEGTQNAALALAGEPCWDARQADGAGGVTAPWVGSAGLSTAGADYLLPALGSVNGNRADANGTEYRISPSADVIKTWFGVVNQNCGCLLVPSNVTGALASSAHATVGWRPKLMVEWHRRYAPLRRIR